MVYFHRTLNNALATKNNENSNTETQSDNFNAKVELNTKSAMETMGNPSDAMAVADVAPSTMIQQITGFVDDAANVPASLPRLTAPQPDIIGASSEMRSHSIMDVLSRPVIVDRGTWSDSTGQGGVLKTLDFPSALFETSFNIVDKLNFFAFFRADVCIRVIVNANTFQCGKLLGYFTPFESLVGDRATTANHISAFTAFPHVLIDASTGNAADLLIPYVAPYSSYRLTDNVGNIGTFNLTVLNNLRTGSCSYTIYAWFTNISVDMPSGLENPSVSAALAKRYGRRFVAQVGGEEKVKSSGVVSHTLDKVNQIATIASGIPIIGDIAAPVSWAANFGARIAEYFGYSKSVNEATPCSMISIPGKGFTNASGVDNSVVLGTSHENALEPRNDLFGSQVDDMDITYICKHRCYVDSFEFAISDGVQDALYSIPVMPGWCKRENGVYEPTTTAFVASMFNFWRGGLRYKIQAAKTAYHSGRLRIIYIPAAVNNTVNDPEQAYNWVLDLRNSSEIEFTIPYNNILEWSSSRLSNSLNPPSRASIGVIRIEVLNELRAPPSVSPTIQFNIWLAGDSDLQFAVPTFQRYVPSLPDPAPTQFVAQVLGSQQDRGFNDMEDKAPLFAMQPVDKLTPCKSTMGEIVTNLRYLTRRFAVVDQLVKAPTTGNYAQFELPSYYFGRVFNPATDDLTSFTLAPIDYISYLYRFFRGGIRWKTMVRPVNSLQSITGYQEATLANDLLSSSTIIPVGSTIYDTFYRTSNAFIHRVYTIINPILEVTVPYYSQTNIRPVIGTDVAQPELLSGSSVLYRVAGAEDNTEIDVFKAAHDDFSFGWIVGPPQLRDRTSAVITVDPSTAVSAIEVPVPFNPPTGLQIDGVTVLTGNVLPGEYTVQSGSPLFNLVLNNTTTLPITGYYIIRVLTNGLANIIVYYDDPTGTGIDIPPTLASIQAAGTLTISV